MYLLQLTYFAYEGAQVWTIEAFLDIFVVFIYSQFYCIYICVLNIALYYMINYL